MTEHDPFLNSMLRVNPLGFVEEDIALNPVINEVQLNKCEQEATKDKNDESVSSISPSYENWIYEEILETPDVEEGLRFSSQEEAFDRFLRWYEKSTDMTLNADSLTCVAVGGRGSGKSYTLFGRNSNSDRGIIPRFLESRFSLEKSQQPSFMLISMYIVVADKMIDLLNPPAQFRMSQDNIVYSESLGILSLPLKMLRTESTAHGLQIIHLGLTAASMIALSSDFLFNPIDIVVSMRMFHPDRVSSMTFVEASTMLFLPSGTAESDRFSPQIHELRSANAFSDCGLFGSSGFNDVKKKLQKAEKAATSSFLTYLLQDAFMLGGCPLYPVTLSGCLVIGCLRGDKLSFSENKFTLDLLQTLTDHFISLVEGARLGGSVDGPSVSLGSRGSERPRTNASVSSDRPGSRNSKSHAPHRTRTPSADSFSVVAHKSLSTEMLLMKIDSEVKYLCSCRQKDSLQKQFIENISNASDENGKVERRLRYYDRKQEHLEEICRHIKSSRLVKKAKRHDLKPIVNWLKGRGIFGMKMLKEQDVHDPDYKIRQSVRGESAGPEEVEISNLPWSSDAVPRDPYLIPITPINISSSYLLLPIPAGHMVVCRSALNAEASQMKKTVSLDAFKQVRVFPLDSVRICDEHCVVFRSEGTVKIRPLLDKEEGTLAFVEVNGTKLEEEVRLQNNDTIRIGLSVIFAVYIPDESDNEDDQPSARHQLQRGNNSDLPSALGNDSENWDERLPVATRTLLRNLVQDMLEHSRFVAHTKVDRAMAKITPTSKMTDAMKMEAYSPPPNEVHSALASMAAYHKALLAETLLAIELVNFYGKEMKRNVSYSLHLRLRGAQSPTSFVTRQYRGAEYGVFVNGLAYDIVARAEVLDNGRKTGRGDSWWWSATILMQRLFLMQRMHDDYVSKCERDLNQLDELYPPSKDPFLDPSEPELLGVCNIHLDSLLYLMDVRDIVPVITFKGTKGGLLKFSLRCWIDRVDTIPSYIKVDQECKLSDFLGRNCIMKFYFESLIDINAALSNDVQVAFGFFVHSGQYRTPRHSARNERDGDANPYLNSVVVVEQQITPDFIQYVQRNSIELEIWGGRIFNKRILKTDDMKKKKKYHLGDPKLPRACSQPKTIEESMKSSITETIEDGSLAAESQSHLSADSSSVIIEEEEEEEEVEKDDASALLAKLKTVTALLEEAERKTKRSVHAATVYKEEIARLTPNKNNKKKNAEDDVQRQVSDSMKEAEIERMRSEILQLQAKMSKQKSKTCTVS